MWLKLPTGGWLNCDKIKEIYCDTAEVVGDIVSQRIHFILDDDAMTNKSRFYIEIQPKKLTLEQATDYLVKAIALNRTNRVKLLVDGTVVLV